MKTGSQVETGAPLLRIEPVAEAEDGAEAADAAGRRRRTSSCPTADADGVRGRARGARASRR